MKRDALDLTKAFPRSPREKLAGYAHLPRMLDKARAKAAGTLGEYIYPCPLDRLLLDFLEIGPDRFYEAAKEMDDQEIAGWVEENAGARGADEIERWNQAFLSRKPADEESMNRFLQVRSKIAPDRTDIGGWIDLIDLEEGREVPPRAAA